MLIIENDSVFSVNKTRVLTKYKILTIWQIHVHTKKILLQFINAIKMQQWKNNNAKKNYDDWGKGLTLIKKRVDALLINQTLFWGT